MTKDKKSLMTTMKEWRSLAEPRRKYSALAFFTYLIYTILRLMDVIFIAKVTSALSVGDYQTAYVFLVIGLVSLAVRNVFSHWQYMNYTNMVNHVYNVIQLKLFDKIIHASAVNFEHTSREYILNTVGSNVDVVSNFEDKIITKSCKAIQLLVAMAIVMNANLMAGLVIVGIAGMNYLLLLPINRYIANSKRYKYKTVDEVFEKMAMSIDGHDVINEFGAATEYKAMYEQRCNKVGEAVVHTTRAKSLNDNFLFALYCCVICAVTIYLVHMVSGGALSLTAYFIIVPYLLSCTELFIELINVDREVKEVKVSLQRINTILNFSGEELAKFGSINARLGGKNISLVGVSYLNTDSSSEYNGVLDDVDISFKNRGVNIVKGSRKCGKRIVFNLLRRNIRPRKGVILLDNIDVQEYDSAAYRAGVYYCIREPEYLMGSIMDNLAVVTKNRRKIYAACRQAGIHDYIKQLPKGYATDVGDHLPRSLLFLIGLARTLLTECDTVMIYGTPTTLNKAEQKQIERTISSLKKTKTVILFTHNDAYDHIASLIYEMENGKVKEVRTNFFDKY